MNKLNPDFNNLEVRLWDGDEWPERRVSLACTENKHAVMISPRYADIRQSQANADEIAVRCRCHDRLVDTLKVILDDYRDACDEWDAENQEYGLALIDQADALLSELSAHNGGDV